MKCTATRPDKTSTRKRAAISLAVTIAAAIIISAGCTSVKEKLKPKPGNPELAARMQLIQRGGVALARSIDDGNTTDVDASVKMLVMEMQAVRSLKPAPRVEGEEVNTYAYYNALDASVKQLSDMRGALSSNRWDLINQRYEQLRQTCIACHRVFVEKPIRPDLPVTRNF